MKRLLAVFLFAIAIAFSCLAQAAPQSSREFTQTFVKSLKAAQPSVAVTVKGDLELVVKDKAGNETTAFLNNAYAQYLRNPAAMDEVIRAYVNSFADARKKAEAIDPKRIVPIIKDRRWLAEIKESIRQKDAKGRFDNVFDDFNAELVIVYAEDTAANINYFSAEAFEKLKIPRSRLRPLAVANLKKLLPRPEVLATPSASIVTVGGDYDASLLLMDDFWAKAPKVEGEIVVAVPARDLLLFTGSRNQPGIEKLRAAAAKYSVESPYGLTSRLFVYRNGRFVGFD